MKISVYGCGFVGITTAACLADLGHEITCIDIDIKKIENLKKGIIPFYEPGLKELVELNIKKGRLNFISEPENEIHAEVIFNCVGTPQNEDGSANLEYVFQVIKKVASNNNHVIFVNKSTVPPGTAKKCAEMLPGKNVISNPEFLKEGNAVHDFMHPDKIVIGGKNLEAIDKLKKVYAGLDRSYLKILETDWETAEIIKYANNAFLATKISFINEIANICDLNGGNIKTVSKALGMDYRISPKFLNAGLGYGGFCFPKDVRALINTAKSNGYDAKLLTEVDNLNRRQKDILLNKIKTYYQNNQYFQKNQSKTLSLWGLTFKPKTSDIREAVSLKIIKTLLELNFKLRVYDPMGIEEIKKIFDEKIIYCNNIEESVNESDGIILITEWDEFRGIDFKELGRKMNHKIIFDGRNIYEPTDIKKSGFEYYGIGRK